MVPNKHIITPSYPCQEHQNGVNSDQGQELAIRGSLLVWITNTKDKIHL